MNAEEEPENVDYPQDEAFKAKFGPRGVIHSYADGRIEGTGLGVFADGMVEHDAMGYQRWWIDHMYAIAPAGAYVGQWLQSFKEFPPRQKPGSFNLDRVMESVTRGAGDK